MKKLSILFALIFLLSSVAYATHNRAGEITYERDLTSAGYVYKATVKTWTKDSSTNADRDSLEIFWGDGTHEFIIRVNGPDLDGNGIPDGEVLPGGLDIKRNIYKGTHTYPGLGTYVLSMTDANRIDAICNISSGSSVNIPFEIEDTLKILDPQFYSFNNSPIIQQEPIDLGNTNEIYSYNPNAYDPDGDSLDYRFTIPHYAPGNGVPGYVFPPDMPGTPPGMIMTIDNRTGQIIWNHPTQCCTVNIAILIREFRNNFFIGSMILDMQIVMQCENDKPPVIAPLHDYCIVAGMTLNIGVSATDPDLGQKVFLSASGGPFQVAPPDTATFVSNSGTINQFASGTFQWNTTCDHVRQQFYSVDFKATDSYLHYPLVDIRSVTIKVVAPEPKNLTAVPNANTIVLNWQNPYMCFGSKKFLGFLIWRREGSNPFVPDTCNPSMNGKGYTMIARRFYGYTYIDADVDRGKDYCYRVQAFFGDTVPTVPDNVFNTCVGLPSDEACTVLKKDVPVITNVSIRNTDATLGSVYVAWSKPNGADLDTSFSQNPPPYKFVIYRSSGFTGSNLVPIDSFTSNWFQTLIDTSYIDSAQSSLNTLTNAYSYQIKFYSANPQHFVGATEIASSPFLNIAAASHQLTLSWNVNAPWTNDSVTIFKKNGTGTFDSITTTVNSTYTDVGLANLVTYCYKIKTRGKYSASGFIDPIINYSQINCGVPQDTVGPCAPTLSIDNSCLNSSFTFGDYKNLLTWNDVNNSCASDAIGYYVYYSPIENGNFILIDSLNSSVSTAYIHDLKNSIAGCYYVTAFDSVHNEGGRSNVFCVSNCPFYELPNVFTPNHDDQNDFFHPFLPYKYIDHVDFKVFDKSGNLVFQTQDPMLSWDGTLFNKGKDLPEGTYYYVCDVFEATTNGVIKFNPTLRGFIHLFR